jgi:hypothetical protein
MVKMIFIIFLVLGFLAAEEDGVGQTLYKWTDEKGAVHFSETPPSQIPSKKDEKQATKESSAKIPSSSKKEEEKTTKENPLNILNKLQAGSRTVPIQSKKDEKQATKESPAKVPNSTNKEEKKTANENSLNILNKLQVGDRTIPDDMKKYGPGGPEAPRRQEQTAGSSSSGRS